MLAQRPEARIKRAASGATQILRRAEPVMQESEHCVDITYRVEIRDGGVVAEQLKETHRMRYFFLPEIESALERAGLQCLAANDLQSGAALGEATWSACVTARKR